MIYRPCVYAARHNKGGAGVARRLCNGLPHNDPGFDSRW